MTRTRSKPMKTVRRRVWKMHRKYRYKFLCVEIWITVHIFKLWIYHNFNAFFSRIPDLEAKKPDDWDENAPEKIVDTSVKKPSDWLDQEPELVPVEKAVKPNDWYDTRFLG